MTITAIMRSQERIPQEETEIVSPQFFNTEECFERIFTTNVKEQEELNHLLTDQSNPLNLAENTPNFEGLFNTFEYDTLVSPGMPKQNKGFKKNTPIKTRKKEVKQPSESSTWKTVYTKCDDIRNIFVKTKTRREEWNQTVPERVYSSLKYSINMSAELGDSFDEDTTFLLARLFVVESNTFQKVTYTKALKGQIEVALTRISMPGAQTNKLQGKTLVQFGDLSFHKEKKTYHLEIHFFLPTDDKNPVIIQRSGEFRVYARKPNKRNYSKKRKAESKVKNNKKKKVKKESGGFNAFVEKLESLVQLKHQLAEEEQNQAVELVYKKFMSNTFCLPQNNFGISESSNMLDMLMNEQPNSMQQGFLGTDIFVD